MRTGMLISASGIALVLLAAVAAAGQPSGTKKGDDLQTAIFAGGCFWCMQAAFDGLPGVVQTTAGYTGGDVENPTYEEVSSGRTGHAEAVEVVYDPAVVTYRRLLEAYWQDIDPTDADGQFADRGSQYRPAIYYTTEAQRAVAQESKAALEKSHRFAAPIVVPILSAEPFWPAEDYHQHYSEKNPNRFQRYEVGSGRAGFLERTWSKDEH